MKKVILWCAFLCSLGNGIAQQYSYALEKGAEKPLWSRSILPLSLIASGILLSDSTFEISLQEDIRNQVSSNFYTKIDDYTRYAPIVFLYGADALGVEAQHHWFDQTKNLVLSAAIAGATTAILKHTVDKKRPGLSEDTNSFPSAHTTIAFVTATTLYEEFKNTNTFLAHSGFVFAIGTGALRIANNKHWVSDVAVGAGIGILATKLVYALDHLWSWNPFLPKNRTVIMPQYQERTLGVYFSKSF